MKIREVSWANYQRLPDGQLSVRDHLVLVGPNDTGKSSIVRAIHLCVGMAHGQVTNAISPRDFTDSSAPLMLTVTLDGIELEDRSAFPDEITIGPPEVLVVALEATLDPSDPDQKNVRRFFPDSGHARSPTRSQLDAIGFEYVPAVRSLLRELGGVRGGAVRSLLSGLDLTADAAALQAAGCNRRISGGARRVGSTRSVPSRPRRGAERGTSGTSCRPTCGSSRRPIFMKIRCPA